MIEFQLYYSEEKHSTLGLPDFEPEGGSEITLLGARYFKRIKERKNMGTFSLLVDCKVPFESEFVGLRCTVIVFMVKTIIFQLILIDLGLLIVWNTRKQKYEIQQKYSYFCPD